MNMAYGIRTSLLAFNEQVSFDIFFLYDFEFVGL